MNNNAPIRENFPVGPNGAQTTSAWDNWFQQVFDGLRGWNRSIGTSAMFDFPSISAQSQQSTTVAVAGAQPGDMVQVMASADVSGVIFTGAVTASGVVTLYAKNFSAGAVNPPSLSFRIIVLQA